jgi:dephospho-CoA kinase
MTKNLIGLTGGIATGKSTVAKDFIKAYFKKNGITKKEEKDDKNYSDI